jgi:hypothetical protein
MNNPRASSYARKTVNACQQEHAGKAPLKQHKQWILNITL